MQACRCPAPPFVAAVGTQTVQPSHQRRSAAVSPAGGEPPRRHRRAAPLALAAAPGATAAAADAPQITGAKNVVVLGGSGRVGSSAAAALAAAVPSATISLASREGDSEAFRAAVARRPELGAAKPLRCDVDSPASLATALKGADLVIHTAGPFQRRQDCNVLEAAIAAGGCARGVGSLAETAGRWRLWWSTATGAQAAG